MQTGFCTRIQHRLNLEFFQLFFKAAGASLNELNQLLTTLDCGTYQALPVYTVEQEVLAPSIY
jgi:hypothetical protein